MSGKHFNVHEVGCCIKYFIFGFNIIFWVSLTVVIIIIIIGFKKSAIFLIYIKFLFLIYFFYFLEYSMYVSPKCLKHITASKPVFKKTTTKKLQWDWEDDGQVISSFLCVMRGGNDLNPTFTYSSFSVKGRSLDEHICISVMYDVNMFMRLCFLFKPPGVWCHHVL